VIGKLCKHRQSWPFLEPVDANAVNIAYQCGISSNHLNPVFCGTWTLCTSSLILDIGRCVSWYTGMVGTGHVHLFQFTRNVWLIAPWVCYCAQKRRRQEYDCVFTSGCNLQRWSWAWVVSNCCGTFLSWIIMVAVWNRAGHYIFILWFLPSIFLSSSFFSLPNLSGRRLDVYHTSTHGVALV